MIKSKCCNSNCFIQEKGNNTGLYCSKCGKWQKWLNKDEINLFKYEQGNIVNNNNNNKDNDYYKNKIIELIDDISKEINEKYLKKLCTLEEIDERTNYCHTLDKIKYKLENILQGE